LLEAHTRLLSLQNTSFVEGVVVYAGHETKAMLNNSGPRYKRSQLEQKMNIDVIWCVIVLIVLCLVGAIGCQLWMKKYVDKNIPFIVDSLYDPWEGFWMFFRLVIILQASRNISISAVIDLLTFSFLSLSTRSPPDSHPVSALRNYRSVQSATGFYDQQQFGSL
jgi:hypothetical protein